MKRFFASLLTCVLLLGLLPTAARAAEDVTLNVASGNIVITGTGYSVGGGAETAYTGNYTLTGTASRNTVTINGGTHTITLQGLNMTNTSTYSGGTFGLQLASTANVTLVIDGTNTITAGGGDGNAVPIFVRENASLTIRSVDGTNNHTLNAIGTSDGKAAIGGSWDHPSGSITIQSGTINAEGGGNSASVIGKGGRGGNNFSSAPVTITGGVINCTAKNQRNDTICIGGNDMSVNVSGCIISAPGIDFDKIFDSSKATVNAIVNDSVVGNAALTVDYTLEAGKTLTIPEGSTLTVAGTITNHGTLTINGAVIFEGSGSISTITGSETAQVAPTEITVMGQSADSITLSAAGTGPAALLQYSKDNSTWQSSPTFTGLSAGTGYTFFARYAKGYTNDTLYAASAPISQTFNTAYATPGANEGYSINYTPETITVDGGYEVNTSQDFSGTAITSGQFLTDRIGGTLYIRKAANGNIPASAGAQITIPARPAAPSGLQGQNTSFAGERDGKITGVSTAMEHKLPTSSSWTPCVGSEITGLAAGEYQVRLKAAPSAFASEAVNVTVDSGDERTYTLTVTNVTFDNAVYGYTQPEAKAITITSTGNSDAAISSVTVSDTGKFIIGGSGGTVTAGGKLETYTIQPNAGLSAGEHTAAITVTYDGGATAAADVSFTVNGAPQDAPAAPELDSRTYDSITLKAAAENANGAAAQYSKDGGITWQDSPAFTGLTPSTKYTFVVRYGAIDSYEASPASAPTEITTEAAPVTMYSVTVNGGTGGGSYGVGDTVTITAAVPAGQRFTGWTVDEGGVTLADASSAATTFTMPAQAVAVTANFEDIPAPTYLVTVSGGAGGGSYEAGATVTITAAVSAGQRFTGWTVDEGGVTLADASSAATTFTMPAQAVTVTANFEAIPTGGGSSGGYIPPILPAPPTLPTYPPTVERPSQGGGAAEVSPSRPERGDTVTVTPRPDEGYEVDKITVTGQNGKPVEVTVRPDGTYTFIQPGGRVTIEIAYAPVPLTGLPWSNPFTDVSEGGWYYEAVRFVQENSLMNGYSNGQFGPDDNLSRAQLAQILFNKEGRPGVNYLMDFSDVADGAWCAGAIRWAASQGIVGGYGNGTFGPDDPITREQLAVMLWRYAGSPAAAQALSFRDTDEISPFALEAMRWAVENGILNGYGSGQLGPQGQATRAQAAQMLKSFVEKQEGGDAGAVPNFPG